MKQVFPEITNVDEIVFRGITSLVSENWVGTMTSLSNSLNRVISKRQREVMPRSPSALRLVINRVVNRIRNKGISVRFNRTTDHSRTRLVRFSR
jgi:hypothetical protein